MFVRIVKMKNRMPNNQYSRVKSVMVEDCNVNLVDPSKDNTNDNYYSIIVGNNGTGKSQILKIIATEEKNNGTYCYDAHSKFSRVIAVTNSVADKFPVDKTSTGFSHKGFYSAYSNQHYVYLGTKMRFGSYNYKYLLDRALRISSEQMYSHEVAEAFRRVFDFLDYNPIVKVTCKIKRLTEDVFKNRQTEFQLSMEKSAVLAHGDIERIQKLSHIFRNGIRREITFIFNFSEKNMSRINDMAREYNEYDLDLLDFCLLRKFNAISSYEMSVFKKNGAEFSFTEASSGEAGILTSFLSIIPLLKDNCLLLVDEPEISLHPKWQSLYMQLLREMLRGYHGCHVIIATHSNLIISDLSPDDSSIVVMRRSEKGKLQSEFLGFSTYAWSAENILLNVFEVPSTRNYYFANMLQEILTIIASKEKDMKAFHSKMEYIQKIKKNLSSIDPLYSIIEKLEEYGRTH